MSDYIVIKIGGRSVEVEETVLALAEDLKELKKNHSLVLVHGGGAFVSEVQMKYGIEPVFQDGLRMTSPAEMDIVDMGLAGRMNKYLVRLFNRADLKAVGLSGTDGLLITAESIGVYQGQKNHTGKVQDIDSSVLCALADNGFFPVVSPVSSDRNGDGINVNADEAAFSIAAALNAGKLIFLTDIQGVLIDGETVSEMHEQDIEEGIKNGKINGGMIPKTRSSVESLKQGVGEVIIGQFNKRNDLLGLTGHKSGTRIVL